MCPFIMIFSRQPFQLILTYLGHGVVTGLLSTSQELGTHLVIAPKFLDCVIVTYNFFRMVYEFCVLRTAQKNVRELMDINHSLVQEMSLHSSFHSDWEPDKS